VILCALAGLFAVLGCLGAVAEPADQPAAPTNDRLPSWAPLPPRKVVEDRFRMEITLFGAALDTKLRVDESLTAPGTKVDAEDDLGLDDFQLLPQVEFTILPGEHHLVRLSGMQTRRSAQKVIDKEIFFEDEVYEPGELVDSTLNLTMFGLTYGYRFIAGDTEELAFTFGFQIVEVETNAVVRSRVVREAESGVAPLPLVGFEGRYAFDDHWSAEGRLQYLQANIEDVDGEILDARLAVTWRMNPYLVFGLGYRSYTVNVDSRDVDTTGLVDMSIAGPLLFVRASL
jgi:hypothetical protein